MNRYALKYFLLTAILIVGFVMSLSIGSGAELSLSEIFWLRLPRAVMSLGVGSALALAGLFIQTVLNNPLAEPFTLGTASGAAVGGVLVSAMVGWMSSVYVLMGSVFGSFLSSGLLLVASRMMGLRSSSILVFGMTLSLLGGSVVAAILALSSDQTGFQALSWLYGDLSRWEIQYTLAMLGLVVIAAVWGHSKATFLDAMLLGDEEAAEIGVQSKEMIFQALSIAAALVGLAVSLSGMIGFVGLMAPHAARNLFGHSHRRLVSASMILGAAILCWGDWLCRILFSPKELPVGVMTALVGVPVFSAVFFRKGVR